MGILVMPIIEKSGPGPLFSYVNSEPGLLLTYDNSEPGMILT